MKKIFFTLLLSMIVTILLAQSGNQVTMVGKIVDKDSQEPVILATVQLLSPKDSAMVNGNVTNADGNFVLRAKPGK